MSNDKNEVEVLPALVEPDYADAAERIRFHLSRARVAADVALKHIIEAGWELAKQKQLLGYGQWCAWCESELEISQRTADKYIATFQKTVGALRAEQSISLDKKLLKKELDAATEGLEEKTVRQAMIEIGVIKPNAGHGGKRKGAGRKAKDETVEKLSRQDEAKAIWNGVMQIVSKSSVRDSIPLLGEKETRICLDGVKLIADLLKKHLQEF